MIGPQGLNPARKKQISKVDDMDNENYHDDIYSHSTKINNVVRQ